MHRYQEYVSSNSNGGLRIYADTPPSNTAIVHWWIWFGKQNLQKAFIVWYTKGYLWIAPSWKTHKHTLKATSCYLQVHRMHAHTRIVATYLLPSTIHTHRWQFWCKICQYWSTPASSVIIKEILWNCFGSYRKQMLWNYAGMGLRKQNSWHKYAKLRS